jgi:alpha-tubulin suppressor-like RCC1 family protein
MSELGAEAVPWEILDGLREGDKLLKIGRRGKPEFREVKVSADCVNLCWESKKDKNGWMEVPLASCELKIGPTTENFARFPIYKTNCFSVLHDNHSLSLDIVCKDKTEFTKWIDGIKFLLKNGPPSEAARKSPDAKMKMSRKSMKVVKAGTNTSAPAGMAGAKKAVDAQQMLKERMEENNDAYSWGQAGWGQLGQGNEDNKLFPTLLESMLGKGIKYISCGHAHTAVITESNDIFTWGAGGCGRLGNGTADSSLTPKQLFVTGRMPWTFVKVSCGDLHTLAMKEDGKLYTWGHGAFGALGHGDCKDFLVPTLVEEISAVDICAGSMCSFVIQDDGKLYSCGEGSHGRLGIGHVDIISATFQCIESLSNVTQIACGEYFTAAIVNSEELYTWGANKDGQLGHGDFIDRSSPELVESFRGKSVMHVSCGAAHMVSIVNVKKLSLHMAYSWGSNSCGQLGQGTTAEKAVSTPHPLTGKLGTSNINYITCGAFHTAALTLSSEKDADDDSNVELYTWGNNTYGQLGVGQLAESYVNTPTLVTYLSSKNTRSVHCGAFHTFATVAAMWINDEEATQCMACKSSFTTFNRRHHCRHCGGVYCSKCSSKKIPLLKFGLVEPQRVCDKCYNKVKGG